MVIDNSDCNSFAADDDSEEDEWQVCGGSYSTDTDDRKKAWIGCDDDGVTAGSTTGVQATKESLAKDHTSCAMPANPPQLKIHFPEPSGTQITNSFTTNH